MGDGLNENVELEPGQYICAPGELSEIEFKQAATGNMSLSGKNHSK